VLKARMGRRVAEFRKGEETLLRGGG